MTASQRALVIMICLVQLSGVDAATIEEFYPGNVLRTEVLQRDSHHYIEAKVVGFRDGVLAMKIEQFDRQVIRERDIHEKVRIVRTDDSTRGTREIIADQVIAGNSREREERILVGPVRNTEFQYLGGRAVTDDDGILRDHDQAILSLFEQRRSKVARLQFASPDAGICEFELTRNKLDELLGITFDHRSGRSCPSKLELSSQWDKPFYRPGDRARLTVTAQHNEQTCNVAQLQGLSMSRSTWLDGKMYYFGDILAGTPRSFTRVFFIPKDAPEGVYYQRIGLRDYSGAKPQLSVQLIVRP